MGNAFSLNQGCHSISQVQMTKSPADVRAALFSKKVFEAENGGAYKQARVHMSRYSCCQHGRFYKGCDECRSELRAKRELLSEAMKLEPNKVESPLPMTLARPLV